MASFESTLASRYLRRLTAWDFKVHLITLSLASVAAVLIGLHVAASRGVSALGQGPLRAGWLWPVLQTPVAQAVINWGPYLASVALVLVGFLIWLLRRFTVFTAISTFGLFLGSSALVVVLSVMSGFEQDLMQKILGANAHLVVTSPGHAFVGHPAVEQRIRQALPAAKVAAFLSSEVMISSQSNLAGVVLKGIDPGSIGEVTDLQKNMELGSLDNLLHPEKLQTLGGPPDLFDEEEEPAERKGAAQGAKEKAVVEFVGTDSHGHKLAPAERPGPGRRVLPGVILGRELAKNLRLYLGDDVNIISPLGDIGPTGPMPRSRAFRVAGIFYSGMYEYDTKYIYLSLPAAQKFLGVDAAASDVAGGEITGFELRLPDPDRTAPAVESLKSVLGAGYEVQDWKELNRNLFSALKVEKIAMFVVLCFIILVAGFSIVANGIMLVREKRREIAILKSMGATDGSVLTSFLYIGLYMGLLGIGAGIATGLGTCWYLGRYGIALDTEVYYISKLPVRMNPWEIASVFLAAMAIVLVATLYPALTAARLRPVDGLRYDPS